MLRCGRKEEGFATVEFALCLIPLLLIVAGIIDFGESWYMQSVLASASREGARYATRYQTAAMTGQRLTPNTLNPSIQDFVLNKPDENGGTYGYGLKDLLPSDAAPTVTLGGAGYTSGTWGLPVNVTVSAEKHWLFLNRLIPVLTDPKVLASTTVMACE